MDDDPLAVWAVASFDAAISVAALVGALHLDGRLGDVLASLDTPVGVALYGCLWGAAWWTVGGWLAGLDGDDGLVDALVAGGAWGGVAGVLFFWAVFALAVAPALGLDIPFALLALVVGSVLALAVGGVVGVLLAAVDAAAFGLAARIAPASGE